jgi:hypothetical protein
MATDNLLQHLRELEVALHQSAVRRDAARIDELLHESFAEFGRSGRSYNRGDILEMLRHEVSGPVWAQDFSVAEIADGIALLTYYFRDGCFPSPAKDTITLSERYLPRGFRDGKHTSAAGDGRDH